MARSASPGAQPPRVPTRAAGPNRAAKVASGATKPAVRRRAPMPARDVDAFLHALATSDPNPRTELDYADPFSLLVAVVLSAQATDASVNRAGRTLFKAAPTPRAMVALGVAGVADHIRSIGLWQTKAANVVALSELLLARHGGQVPDTREALEALPGVGRKTANVVLNVAFGQPTVAVDTHIFRVCNRTGLAPGNSPRVVEDGLLRRVPKPLLHDVHHLLILHGRHVCQARRPACWRCVGARWCRFPEKVLEPQAGGVPAQAT